MKCRIEPFGGIQVIKQTAFKDSRGEFLEVFRAEKFNKKFVQDNVSISHKGVIRGMHYQVKKPQAKLIQVLSGELIDVMVDVRQGSETFGDSFKLYLNDKNNTMVYIPEGFAHGFQSLADNTILLYKCTNYYSPRNERTLFFNDPNVNIEWEDLPQIVSEKDLRGLSINDCEAITLV